ncbi:hypothetical protein PR003_g6677 [Phytophthora rubi]|uniref:Uncharacterized protein n=1 Tax=Phytophthora rubi TaxID=129364 RepID=A0A6A4FPP0_9STRA|nr:hypothetical protein PR001_g11982 [Phytophthora rubi]KAE9037715.1 hypothetical protein PR002_g6416 [Phytophthora rubi]KAE9347916.1 hypothetical protein PR003_g6677 [Phytophthora rubi]
MRPALLGISATAPMRPFLSCSASSSATALIPSISSVSCCSASCSATAPMASIAFMVLCC